MKYNSATDESGFTLIEVIVAIVLVASLSGIMIVFLSDSLVKSSQSIGRLKKVAALNTVMANIVQDYNKYPKWRSGVNYNNPDKVIPTVRNGNYYQCIAVCPSTAHEPDWTTTLLWTASPGLPDWSNLQLWIGTENTDQNNAYGKYHVEKNRCVSFPSDYEQDDACSSSKILKVTIRSDQGEALTALFLFN
ncbi:MAG: prepilin-type N-terminal cleavage/methylation domain-containing protein [Syntrophales bacterium]